MGLDCYHLTEAIGEACGLCDGPPHGPQPYDNGSQVVTLTVAPRAWVDAWLDAHDDTPTALAWGIRAWVEAGCPDATNPDAR